MTAEPQMSSVHPQGSTADTDHDRNVPEVDLLTPLSMRGITFRNRIAVSPMCQYSSDDGFANDWHLVHLGSRASGGAGLVFVEATAVAPEGRITPKDLGIWSDAHVEQLARIVTFLKSQGAVAGIQLAHAGRKASTDVPWKGGAPLRLQEGAWEPLAPSPLPFDEGHPVPRELDEAGIDAIVNAFIAAVKRSLAAGFQVIEIHSAHGYLLNSFLSPLSNHRTDAYGGSLENRMRLLLRVATKTRRSIPDEMPLFVRISATDWVEGGWDLEQSVVLARALKDVGVDLIDCSSGGVVPRAQIPVEKNYQVPLAAGIRSQAGICTGAVGLITGVEQANQIITSGAADLVLIGREMLRQPYWALTAQHDLNQDPDWPVQYGYAVRRRKR